MDGNLIDTNVMVSILRGDLDARAFVRNLPNPCISVTVLGELLFGAGRSRDREKNRQAIEEMLSETGVIPIDHETAASYSEIKNELVAKGKPIPDNDIWIAAVAHRHEMPLITMDGHFDHVGSIRTIYPHNGRWQPN
jgi:tRNA(fMet)-specific endonuclease VapC